jgi:hypothetical protein
MEERLARAREEGLHSAAAVESDLGNLADQESGVVIDLFVSYRAVEAWDRMIALAEKMPPPLRNTVMVQEQLGLALNRAGKGKEAERVLLQVWRSAARAARRAASWGAFIKTVGRRRSGKVSGHWLWACSTKPSRPICGASSLTGATTIRGSTRSP